MNLNDVRGKLDVLAANQRQLEWYLYNRIDPAMVYEILQKHAADLGRLQQILVDAILKHPDVPAGG